MKNIANYRLRIDHIILFLLFQIAFISYPWLSFYSYFKYATLVLIGVYVIFNIKRIIYDKRMIFYNLILLLYCILMIISSYINRGNFERDTFLASIVGYGTLFELLVTFEIFWKKKFLNTSINILCKVYIFYVLINGILVLLLGSKACIDGYYFTGNKFSISYLCIMTIVICWVKQKLYNEHNGTYKLLLLFVFSYLIIFLVDCDTGIVGLTLLLLLYIIRNRFYKLISSPINILILLALAVSFVYSFNAILQNGFVQYFIVDILHSDLSMTGRSTIFANLPKILAETPILGFGYGSEYELLSNFMGAPDAQNGFFSLVLQGGYISAILYCILLVYPFIFIKKKKTKVAYPFYSYIVIFVILSSIEITFSFVLLFASLMAYMLSINDSYMASKICFSTTQNKLNYSIHRKNVGEICL